MFLLSLFHGYSGFDLMHNIQNRPQDEFFLIDKCKFRKHANLCKHLEMFISSYKNSDTIIDLLLSSSLPVLVCFKHVYIFIFF